LLITITNQQNSSVNGIFNNHSVDDNQNDIQMSSSSDFTNGGNLKFTD